MEEVGRIAEANASPGREALRLVEVLITPFTFVASTCLQSGISLIKEDATPVEKGRCFHFLLAAAISVIGLAWCLIAIGENEQGNTSEVKKLMISIWMIFFMSLSVMMTPLFFSLLYIVYDVSNMIATWSTQVAVSPCVGGFFLLLDFLSFLRFSFTSTQVHPKQPSSWHITQMIRGCELDLQLFADFAHVGDDDGIFAGVVPGLPEAWMLSSLI
ncbi:hypothetical protein SELMODRAFT_421529 [Selaginella moellendorffii]|uniref:Uncharacterized protein n=1 Tax=Selaginella moellendorffii TaxID=88036 RepID=D8SFK1_SELML|nr:hypothetical protein SELMODRAFT_432267 [Selaginella moellendorffii]EFJ16852.1 hypothetical protein SELMODRAFT_421529 [Selaginella moellendorffii]